MRMRIRIRIRDDVEKRNKLLQELTRHREQLELLVMSAPKICANKPIYWIPMPTL